MGSVNPNSEILVLMINMKDAVLIRQCNAYCEPRFNLFLGAEERSYRIRESRCFAEAFL